MKRTGPALTDNLREAARSLTRARLRTVLGLIGIMIGIASVIAMISTGEIATAESRRQFEALGTDIVTVTVRGKTADPDARRGDRHQGHPRLRDRRNACARCNRQRAHEATRRRSAVRRVRPEVLSTGTDGKREGNPAMEFEERKEKSAFVVSPAGRLDGVGARVLEDRVCEVVARGQAVVVLDCSRLSYVSSTGLRALLLSAKMCRLEGGELTLAALRPECRRVVEVSGLLSVLGHHETVRAALAAQGRTVRSRTRRPPRTPGQAAMTIEETKNGPAVVLFPVGQLNGDGARALEARVSEIVGRGEVVLLLDCVGMSYVNSTGLRALLLCAKICRQEGGKLAIARLLPECRSVLDMSGFLSVIDYHETSEAALAALA